MYGGFALLDHSLLREAISSIAASPLDKIIFHRKDIIKKGPWVFGGQTDFPWVRFYIDF